jgi:hypothetical protein
MAIRVKGTTNLQEVDINGNAHVNGPLTDVQAGFQSMLAENDAGTVTGSRYVKAVEVSDDFRVRVGLDTMIFNDQFPGATFNTGLWQNTNTTMTSTVASGFANLNAGLSIAAGAVAQLRTYRHFPCYKQYTTYAESEVQFTQSPVSGNRCEWGLMLVSGTALPTDGAFFRITETGEFRAVLSYNGSETQSIALNATTLILPGTTHSFLIYVGSTVVEFWIDNVLVSEIKTPAGQGSSLSSMNLPLSFRSYNVSATSLAQVMKIGNINVTWGDQNGNKPWGHILSGSGAHATQGQTGATIGSTANYSNAAAAAAVALSNTTPGAGNIGLGGIINVLPTLAAGTDGILCSYQVPLGTSILPGRSLYITGIKINSVVTTTLAGGPVICATGIAYGHTAASLATTETAASKAPRRLGLGIQNFALNAAVGVQGQEMMDDYTVAPICVHPGEFFQVALRNLGTVTSTGVITFVVGITGYWE